MCSFMRRWQTETGRDKKKADSLQHETSVPDFIHTDLCYNGGRLLLLVSSLQWSRVFGRVVSVFGPQLPVLEVGERAPARPCDAGAVRGL